MTPTFQKQRFFVRGDASVVHALSVTSGDAFGKASADAAQARGVLESGFLFLKEEPALSDVQTNGESLQRLPYWCTGAVKSDVTTPG